MLTEGWDANTVTHVLGVRAFGTQLLCEQVIGRALRRQSYDLNEDGLFDVEYADVLGIPFDFTAKPVVAPPQPPRETVQVQAVRPERDAPGDPLPARRGLPRRAAGGAPDRRRSTPTRSGADAGPRRPVDHAERRASSARGRPDPRAPGRHAAVARAVPPHQAPALHEVARPGRGAEAAPVRPAQADHPAVAGRRYLVCKGGTYPAQLMYQELADMACERITAGITRALVGERPIKAVLDPYNPTGSTAHVNFTTSKPTRWQTDAAPLPRQLGGLRQRLGGRVLPRGRGAPARARLRQEPEPRASKCRTATAPRPRRYLPDFIVLVDDGHGDDDLLHLVVEIKGYRGEDAKEKKATMETYWVPGVNNLGTFGRWAFAEFTDVYEIEAEFEAKVRAAQFDDMLDRAWPPVGVPETVQTMARRRKTDREVAEDRRDAHATTRPRARTSRPPSSSRCCRRRSRRPSSVAYERRNRDLDPQLVWRGKDEQDWSDLVVQAPPLYIQEKVHPKVLIDDLLRQTQQARRRADRRRSSTSSPTSTACPKGADKTEFYQHDQNWSNRMILGDTLQVMASLAEREGLRGKVQCIYIDPPYGIKFNSNFQWSTTSRDVKDGNAEHITREPEQVKAFRDTWRDGIHSYLTYLRDRLTVARDLLAESGIDLRADRRRECSSRAGADG